MAEQPTIEVRNLRTHFFTKAGGVKAVDDVSFSVGKGRILGLVGESGSGKSVPGFWIMGLVDPPGRVAGGEILFQGRNLAALSEEEMRQIRGARIAMIFQDPMMTLNPVLRIDTQMIETVLAHEKVSEAEARAMESLEVEVLDGLGIADPYRRQPSPPRSRGALRTRAGRQYAPPRSAARG